jgi:hypothetical protein
MKVTAATIALVALAAALPAVAGTSGVRGVVSRGPTMPVCMVGTPCSKPAPGVKLTFVRGAVSRSTTSGADGSYRIALAPGTYRVLVAAKFGYAPRTVIVPSARVVVKNITIDTGIR